MLENPNQLQEELSVLEHPKHLTGRKDIIVEDVFVANEVEDLLLVPQPQDIRKRLEFVC